MSRFSLTDTRALADLLREVARAEVIPHFRRLDPAAVRAKSGPLDLVTSADEAAERAITEGLQRRFPGCAVIGEEAASADATVLGRMADAALAFVVDPIDGTQNYVAGLPLFGMMVAAVVRGDIVAAIIYDPLSDDCALALRGEGAWREAASGTRRDLRVATPVPVRQMTGVASWRFLPPGLRAVVAANLTRVAASFELRCAAHEYRMLASGYCHFLLFNRLMPWDHAPGWLLHREAGGFAARFDGTPYDPTRTDGGLICTPDEASFHALRAALLDG